MPIVKIKYICKEMLRVCLSFITFTTCGIKDIVVKNAARYPIISIIVILITMILKKIKIKNLTIIMLIFFSIIDITISYLYYNYCKNFVEKRVCDNADAAIVFFAGLDKNYNLNALQLSRINKAIQLYNSKIVNKIVCVGGNRPHNNIYGSRKSANYILSKGIPESDVFYDTLSFDTKTNLREADQIAKKYNMNKLVYVSDAIHLHRISLFSNHNAYCLKNIDYQFSFFEVLRMTNQSFFSFILEKLLSEENYIKFIHSMRS